MRSRKVFSRIALPALGGAAAAVTVIVIAAVLLPPRLCDRTSRDSLCRPAVSEEDPGDLSTVVEVTAKEPDIASAAAAPPAAAPQLETAAHLLDLTFGSLSSQPPAAAAPAQDPGTNPAAPQRLVVRSVPVGANGKPILGTTAEPMAALPTPAPLVVPDSEETPPAPDLAFTARQVPAPELNEPEVAAPVPLTRPAGLSEEAPPPSDAIRRTVVAGGVNVRSGPSSSEARLYALAPGATVTVLDRDGGWLKVLDGEGRTGWVDQDYVR